MPSDAPKQAAPEGGQSERDALDSSISAGVATLVPHNRALGIRFLEARSGSITLALPYDEKLVGDPATRVLHGGAITTLMDATCGIAVFIALKKAIQIATLDLRIDYLKPAVPDEEVHARAHCFKVTRNVAFVRCETFHAKDPTDLVAVANGTFMLIRPTGSEAKSAEQ
jgi:uncharacterized protein (TIGR00369 family)